MRAHRSSRAEDGHHPKCEGRCIQRPLQSREDGCVIGKSTRVTCVCTPKVWSFGFSCATWLALHEKTTETKGNTASTYNFSSIASTHRVGKASVGTQLAPLTYSGLLSGTRNPSIAMQRVLTLLSSKIKKKVACNQNWQTLFIIVCPRRTGRLNSYSNRKIHSDLPAIDGEEEQFPFVGCWRS